MTEHAKKVQHMLQLAMDLFVERFNAGDKVKPAQMVVKNTIKEMAWEFPSTLIMLLVHGACEIVRNRAGEVLVYIMKRLNQDHKYGYSRVASAWKLLVREELGEASCYLKDDSLYIKWGLVEKRWEDWSWFELRSMNAKPAKELTLTGALRILFGNDRRGGVFDKAIHKGYQYAEFLQDDKFTDIVRDMENALAEAKVRADVLIAEAEIQEAEMKKLLNN